MKRRRKTPAYIWSGIFQATRRGALVRGLPFLLTRADFNALVERANGHCMVSGVAFDFAFPPGSARRPFTPSVDRIDSTKGYTPDNVRLVCTLVNFAMNTWGVEPLLQVARNLVAREQEILAKEAPQETYRPAEWLTVREYTDLVGIAPSRFTAVRLTNEARRICALEGTEYTHVETRIQQRRDGSWLTGQRCAFPRTVLDRAATTL